MISSECEGLPCPAWKRGLSLRFKEGSSLQADMWATRAVVTGWMWRGVSHARGLWVPKQEAIRRGLIFAQCFWETGRLWSVGWEGWVRYGTDIAGVEWSENFLYLGISERTCKVLQKRWYQISVLETWPCQEQAGWIIQRRDWLITIRMISCYLLGVRHCVSDGHRFRDEIILETLWVSIIIPISPVRKPRHSWVK